MSVSRPLIDNRQARRIFMHRQGLAAAPNLPQSKAQLNSLVRQLGFVQIDSIRTVERAHHMILFARNHNYQREHLRQLGEEDRQLFEHWTHDASIIPIEFYSHWRRRFKNAEQRLRERRSKLNHDTVEYDATAKQVLTHIKKHGPTMSRDLRPPKSDKSNSGGWWQWHPSKQALEFLWRTGELSVSKREGFQKVYDLSKRVVPDALRGEKPQSTKAFVQWSCREALERLGFATATELAEFWGSIKTSESKVWCDSENDLLAVDIENVDGTLRQSFVRPQLLEKMESLPEVPDRIRVLSPFDPLIRDRKRLQRLFGFDYRIEVFVPESKRQYGYYVFPLLEKDRMIGRIDMKAERRDYRLHIKGLWLEPGVKYTKARQSKLRAELNRYCRFVGMKTLTFEKDYLKI